MNLPIPRPQPLGVTSPPLGFLLYDSVRPEWMLGQTPGAGDFRCTGDDPIAVYNRFVMTPDGSTLQEVRAQLPNGLQQLLDAYSFAEGLIDTAPDADGLDGEFRALVLMVRASACLESDHIPAAIEDLEQAAASAESASPVLAAQLRLQLASLFRSGRSPNEERAIAEYRRAEYLAQHSIVPALRAEIGLQLGIALQESANGRRGVLMEAVRSYQKALQTGISLTQDAELYASAHNHLALAYLSMPMTEAADRLRMGIAVQSFQEALKVYQPETHPELSVSTRLNLANALQYLPSSHSRENLMQAVEIYEDLLRERNRAKDPVGYARLLLNQSNALAHLGAFSAALAKLNESYKLLHWYNQPEMAASAMELVGSINERIEMARQADARTAPEMA